MTQAAFALKGRNPDVLSCIANLSNDEVFTPPELANRLLDTLTEAWAADHEGASLWANPEATFLDPCTKSGVFLREITKRLIAGLEGQLPDLQARVDHILTRQVFGLGITELTAMLARRSLYCSKQANGPHSITRQFDSEAGHIWFERVEHSWKNGKCLFCGASKKVLDRGEDRETHAYAFIHTNSIQEWMSQLFGGHMQFDVIIGNPPYQLASDGGTRDVPIYQHFVEQAKTLQPRYLSMVIPSRWMASGLGLSEFRNTMLNDARLRSLHDFYSAKDVFPGVNLKGGACFFLWDRVHQGTCDVTTARGNQVIGPDARKLNDFDVFVRDIKSVKILRKVVGKDHVSINRILARDKEFGWTSNFDDFHNQPQMNDVELHYIRKTKRRVGYINRSKINKSAALIDYWKVLVPKASVAGEEVPQQVVGKPLIAPSPSVCTQSFLFFYVDSQKEAESVQSYYKTRFFRFLVSLRKITQDATHSTYLWVPMQPWDRTWTDADLFAKYGISPGEQSYIETLVRSMQ